MSSFQHPGDGPDPLCNGNWVPNNPTWFAFIAWCEELELTVEIDNCSVVGPPFNQTFGAQVGVYSDCSNFTEVDCIGNDCNNEDDKVLDLEGLVIGEVYYFMIDGCLGSACDVEISVVGNCTEEIEDWTNESIDGNTETCAGFEEEYSVDDLTGATSYHWYVDGSEVEVTDGPDNTLSWSSAGTYELCVDVSNECIDETDDPDEICETITVYDPDAGTLDATPNPLCPGEISDVSVSGYNSDPEYEQVLIFVDPNGEVLEIITPGSMHSFTYDQCGTITVYSLNYPDNLPVSLPSVGSSYSGSDCTADCCDEVSLEIEFEDDIDPMFTNPPADLNLACFGDVPPAVDLMATDNCAADATVAPMESDNSDMCDGGTIVREWEFEDDCGNMIMHTQTINIDAIDEPEYLNPPADVVLDCSDMIPVAVDLDYTNNGSGACLIEGTIVPAIDGMFDPCGTIILYEWDYTDFCGNNINHVQSIEILPAALPQFLNPPSDLVLDCEDAIPPPTNLDYTNSDSGPCLVEGSVAPTVTGSFDACGSIISYFWEFTDACNNTIEHEQVIEILPSEEASFINPPSDITLDCVDFLNYTIEDLDYSNASSGSCEISGTESPVITEDTDACGGAVLVDYEFEDDCGRVIFHRQTITINPPTQADFLSMPADLTVDCSDIPDPAGSLGYSNEESGICLIDGAEEAMIDEDVNECGGTITNTWEFIDDCGRSTLHVQIIDINPAPMAEFENLPSDITLDCDEFNEFDPDILDYSNDEAGLCLISGTIDPEANGDIDECGGIIEYIWSFTDNCGRTIEHSQFVTVNPAPMAEFINVPQDMTLDCESVNDNLPFLEYDNEESGICRIQGFIEAVAVGTVNECGGSLELSWTFTDECNRTITESQSLEFLPASDPEFEDFPEDMILDCDEEVPEPEFLEYTNDEDSPCEIAGEVEASVEIDENIYTYTWAFTNNCTGNMIEHTQTIEKLIPVEFLEDEFDVEICMGNEFDLESIDLEDINNTLPDYTFHDDLPPDSGNEIDPIVILEDDEAEFYIVGTNIYGCFDVASVFFIAEESVSAGEDIEDMFCIGPTLLDLYSFLEPPASLEGEFTQTDGPELDFSFADEIDVSEAEPGVYVFEYYVESGNSCPDDMSEMTIELMPEVDIDLISIECAADGNSYSVILSNNNYDFNFSDGVIQSETTTEIVIVDIPISSDLQVEVEDKSSDCEAEYLFNAPDCSCPAVSIPVSDGNRRICLGDAVPGLSVSVGPNETANWYDAATGGNLLLSNSLVYLPDVTMPGIYIYYAEAESLIQEGCTSASRTAVRLEILTTPPSIDTFYNVCNYDGTGFESFTRQELTSLIDSNLMNLNFTFYRTFDDYLNDLNPIVFPFVNDSLDHQLIYVRVLNGADCESLSQIDLRIHQIPEVNLSVSDEICLDDGNGAVFIDPINTNDPVFYFLNGNTYNSDTIDNLVPGTYELIVEDSLSCRDTIAFEIAPGFSLEFQDFSWTCFDNGTSSDNTDDYYEISFLVTSNLGASFLLESSDMSITSAYNYDENIILQLPADGTSPEFYATDAFFTQCESDTMATTALIACSTDCQILTEVLEFECNNNGTEIDPSDDFYIMSLELNALNPGSENSYELFVDGMSIGVYSYGTLYFLNIPTNPGPQIFEAVDTQIPGCSLELGQFQLPPCSDACSISIQLIGSECDNNGTLDSNEDDIYNTSVIVNAINASDSFTVANFNERFAYGDTIQLESMSVEIDSFSVTIIDSEDTLCTDSLVVYSTGPCSDPCEIIVEELTLEDCDNRLTSNNIEDDIFEISFVVQLIEGDAQSIIITDNLGNDYGPFNYGERITIDSLPSTGEEIIFEIRDTELQTCYSEFSIISEPCSEPCSIETMMIGTTCFDNNTPETNDDDLFSTSILVTAIGGSDSGFITNLNISGLYGDSIDFNDILISDPDIILEISDSLYLDCFSTIQINAPPPCSVACELELTGLNTTICDNNGTPLDPSDDFYFVDLEINTIAGESSQYSISASDNSSWGDFNYNELISIGPFSANGDTTQFEITDVENTSCFLSFETSQNSCSDDCELSIEILDVECFDNDTPETNDDDLFNSRFIINSINASSEFVISNFGITASYGDTIEINNLLIADGNINIEVLDSNNQSCPGNFEIQAPEACSSPCDVNLDVLTVLACNDNATGNDLSDDFYLVEVLINANEGTSSLFSLQASDGQLFGPFSYNNLITIGPFQANSENYFVILEDSENPVCNLQFEFSQDACSSCDHTLQLTASKENLNCESPVLFIEAFTDDTAISYEWEGNTFNSTSDNNRIEVLEAGTYSLTVSYADQCEEIASIDIAENFETPEAISVSPELINCEDSTALLDGSESTLTSNTSIQWLDANGNVVSNQLQFETSFPGIYTLILTDDLSLCQSESEPVEIMENFNTPSIIVLADPGNIFDCVIQTIDLSTIPEDHTTYNWIINNEIISSELSISVNNPSEVILLALDTISACENQEIINFDDFTEYPLLEIEGDYQLDCESLETCIQLTTNSFSNDLQISWYDSNSNLIDQDIDVLCLDQSGQYYVEVMDLQNFCTNTDSFAISNAITPEAFLPSEVLIQNDQNNALLLEILSPPEWIANVQWSTGSDLSCYDCLNPLILSATDGELFSVTLTSISGCEITLSTRVRLEEEIIGVYIPNVFSPGFRSNFTIFASEEIEIIQGLYIYDRWGELVFVAENFEPNNPELGWDGRMNDIELEQGVYVYLVIYQMNGRTVRDVGDVTLLW